MADFSRHLDKAFESKSFEELADAPLDALEGVSKNDAELLLKAFNIQSATWQKGNSCSAQPFLRRRAADPQMN